MLFDIGWPELLLIGVVALVVIGPKDLPRALRVAGYWVRKARTLSREFHSSVEQMIREAELDEMRQQLKKGTEFDIKKEFEKKGEPHREPPPPPHPPPSPRGPPRGGGRRQRGSRGRSPRRPSPARCGPELQPARRRPS